MKLTDENDKITLDKISKTVNEFEEWQLKNFKETFSGITCIKDESGLLSPMNGYVILCGRILYDRLKQQL